MSIPYETRLNGSLYIHIIVHPYGTHPFRSGDSIKTRTTVTTYAFAQAEAFNLMSDTSKQVTQHISYTHKCNTLCPPPPARRLEDFGYRAEFPCQVSFISLSKSNYIPTICNVRIFEIISKLALDSCWY